jgi:hypothetical protein
MPSADNPAGKSGPVPISIYPFESYQLGFALMLSLLLAAWVAAAFTRETNPRRAPPQRLTIND